MKALQLLLATIIAAVIGSPIVVFSDDTRGVQQMTGAAVQLPIEGELPLKVSCLLSVAPPDGSTRSR
jgi:hypothetical protein